MTRSHEYAEMASRTESMSGQMSEDLSQQFAQYVMKHAHTGCRSYSDKHPIHRDCRTSSGDGLSLYRKRGGTLVLIMPGGNPVVILVRMESVPSGGGSQILLRTIRTSAIIEQRTQDSNIRNDVKHQVDNMVTEYKGNIGDTQNSVRGEENIVEDSILNCRITIKQRHYLRIINIMKKSRLRKECLG